MYPQEEDAEIYRITVTQNEDGIDTENRIEKMLKKHPKSNQQISNSDNYKFLIIVSLDFNSVINTLKEIETEIKEAKILKTAQEIEEYIKNISLKGFGGTDFRPVFQYVDEIFTSSQKNEVNGLIYFTDGDGVYPKQMPKFKSVFIINDSCFDKAKMPLWATPLFLDSQDLIG